MNSQNLASFHLKVDYLSFNMPSEDFFQIEKIANYLADEFRCQSCLINDKTNEKKYFRKIYRSEFRAEFRQKEIDHWNGTSLRIKGNHAHNFYMQVKEKGLDNSIFGLKLMKLARTDIKYDRVLEDNDPCLLSFLQTTHDVLKLQKNKTVDLDLEKRILKIGKRESPYRYRVYLQENGACLRFELEVKRNCIKRFQHSFFQTNFEQFEKDLVYIFFQQSLKNFDINHSYLDWLKSDFRKIKSLYMENNTALSLTYLESDLLTHERNKLQDFYIFLQLLKFLRNGRDDSIREEIGYGTVYQSYKFPLYKLVKFIGYDKSNRYQMRKLKNFFENLVPFTTFKYFSDTQFEIISGFPVVRVQKIHKTYYLFISVQEELLDYFYPFHFPSHFFSYTNLSDLDVKCFLMASFAQRDIQKILNVEDFLSKYSCTNQQLSIIKKNLIFCIEKCIQHNVVKPEFTILTKTGESRVETKLTPRLLTKLKSIQFDEPILFQ
jgi:hypothetical protein